jgi:hypothetical protein
MTYNALTYSDIHKSILWTPQKTGSFHAVFIFTHFDFSTEFFDKETFELSKVRPSNIISHHHNCIITEQTKDYDVICTTRNPYARLLSAFFYFTDTEKTELTVQNFRKFFVKQVEELSVFHDGYYGYSKVPKYFLKLENLYEDYIKIPFIQESKLNQCGILYDLCKMKMNKSRKHVPTSDFFTVDMVNYFYDNFRNLFDIDGYEKDSYKKYN